MHALMRNLHSGWLDAWTPDQKRHPHIKFEWKTLAFDKTELAQMISVIRRVYDECIFQFTQTFQLLQHVNSRERNQ